MNAFNVHKALKSVRSLSDVLGELTETEVLHVLQVEAGSRRRGVMLDKLIQKAAEFHYRNYLKSLQEKYRNGKKQNPQPR